MQLHSRMSANYERHSKNKLQIVEIFYETSNRFGVRRLLMVEKVHVLLMRNDLAALLFR